MFFRDPLILPKLLSYEENKYRYTQTQYKQTCLCTQMFVRSTARPSIYLQFDMSANALVVRVLQM
jgi:hypothetical protein